MTAQALRTRLEGALETVEQSTLELEHAAQRLEGPHPEGLVQAVALQTDGRVTSALAAVSRLAKSEPSLTAALARFEAAKDELNARLRRRATTLRETGELADLATAAEREPILLEAATPGWTPFVVSAVVVGLFAMALFRGSWLAGVVGALCTLPLFGMRTKFVVTPRRLCLGRAVHRLENVTRITITRHGAPTGTAVTLESPVFGQQVTTVHQLPKGFEEALARTGVEVRKG